MFKTKHYSEYQIKYLFARALSEMLQTVNNDIPVLILGDFNVNIYKEVVPVCLQNTLHNFKQIIQTPTMDD